MSPLRALVEILLFPVVEVLVLGGTYWTGYFFLKGVTFGTLNLARPLSIGDPRHKAKRSARGLWISLPGEGEALRAEVVCVVGSLVWVALGLGVYWAYR